MIMSHYFFNWLILEARAEIQNKNRCFFGSNENFEICFWDLLTFRITLGTFRVWSQMLPTKLVNSQYMRNPTIFYPVKIEYGWNLWFTISFIICRYATNLFFGNSSMCTLFHFYCWICAFDQNSFLLWGKFI